MNITVMPVARSQRCEKWLTLSCLLFVIIAVVKVHAFYPLPILLWWGSLSASLMSATKNQRMSLHQCVAQVVGVAQEDILATRAIVPNQ
jgi:hypothetical protein